MTPSNTDLSSRAALIPTSRRRQRVMTAMAPWLLLALLLLTWHLQRCLTTWQQRLGQEFTSLVHYADVQQQFLLALDNSSRRLSKLPPSPLAETGTLLSPPHLLPYTYQARQSQADLPYALLCAHSPGCADMSPAKRDAWHALGNYLADFYASFWSGMNAAGPTLLVNERETDNSLGLPAAALSAARMDTPGVIPPAIAWSILAQAYPSRPSVTPTGGIRWLPLFPGTDIVAGVNAIKLPAPLWPEIESTAAPHFVAATLFHLNAYLSAPTREGVLQLTLHGQTLISTDALPAIPDARPLRLTAQGVAFQFSLPPASHAVLLVPYHAFWRAPGWLSATLLVLLLLAGLSGWRATHRPGHVPAKLPQPAPPPVTSLPGPRTMPGLEPFDPRQLLQSCVDAHQPAARTKGLLLFSHIDTDVPACVIGDPDRLTLILHQLLGNAIRFTEAGHVIARLHARPDGAARTTLMLQVADSGPGIPSQQLQSLSWLFQAPTTPALHESDAMPGLTLAARLARALPASLRITSEPGLGSSFNLTLTLPLGPADTAAASPRLDGLHISVRSPHAELTTSLCQWFRAWGGHAWPAGTISGPPGKHQVLLDALMPQIRRPGHWAGCYAIAGMDGAPGTGADLSLPRTGAMAIARALQAALLRPPATPEEKPPATTGMQTPPHPPQSRIHSPDH